MPDRLMYYVTQHGSDTCVSVTSVARSCARIPTKQNEILHKALLQYEVRTCSSCFVPVRCSCSRPRIFGVFYGPAQPASALRRSTGIYCDRSDQSQASNSSRVCSAFAIYREVTARVRRHRYSCSAPRRPRMPIPELVLSVPRLASSGF